MTSDFCSINLHIPKRQKEFCDKSNKSMKELYIDAFDEKYLFSDTRIRKIKELTLQIEQLNNELEQEKSKPLSKDEIVYLKESKESPTSPIQAQKARLEGFKYHFGRHYLTMDEFLELVKKVNNNG